MSQPRWDRSSDAWIATVKCPAFGTLEVDIKTGGETDPPSDKQLEALAKIAALPKTVRKPIRKSVRRYARAELDPEELEDFEPEDFNVEFSGALIPPLRHSEAVYFFLYGDSEIDIEHGLACLCKGGDTFCICSTDAMYEPYPCDATQAFEEILGSQAVKLEEP